MISYIMIHVLGMLLTGLYIYSLYLPSKNDSFRAAIRQLLDKFHDSTAFVCFSIQVAAFVLLIREEAGISTSGMGDGTVKITEAVSLLTLLPLAYAFILLERERGQHASSSSDEKDSIERQYSHTGDLSESTRFPLLVLCWLLAFFPFYCKMNNAWAPSKISNQPGAPITLDQFDHVTRICLEGVQVISPAESTFMAALAVLCYVPMSVIVLGRVVFLALQKHHQGSGLYKKLAHKCSRDWVSRTVTWALIAIPLLAAGLLWSVFRVKRFQVQLTQQLNVEDPEGEWAFGQVAAVTVFAPVFIEVWIQCRLRVLAWYDRLVGPK